jgi:hypothetical protein
LAFVGSLCGAFGSDLTLCAIIIHRGHAPLKHLFIESNKKAVPKKKNPWKKETLKISK